MRISKYNKVKIKVKEMIGMKKEILKEVKGTLSDIQFADLKGSEKQIEWAKKIRSDAIGMLFRNEILKEDFEDTKRDVKRVVEAMMSEESIKKYIDELPDFLRGNAVKTMNRIYDRYKRLEKLAQEDKATFWIDNRDNQSRNYMFKNFITYIKTGERKWENE